MGFEVDNLITAIRDDAELSPNAESTQSTALLRALNREQRLFLTTLLERCKQQHKQAYLDDTTPNGTKTRFDIPTRAVAAGIKMIEGIGSSGIRWMLHELPDDEYARGWPRNGDFYFEGNQLVFYKAPASGTLRVTYSRRLSELVLLASVAPITAISGGTITATSPAGYATASTAYDFVKATPHFDILAMDKNATRSGNTFTFTAADVPSSLAVGDHVCIAGQTTVCQAPLELHDVLALRVAYTFSAGKNDGVTERLKGLLSEAMASAASILNPRSTTEAVLINPNSPGWQRGKRYRTSGSVP